LTTDCHRDPTLIFCILHFFVYFVYFVFKNLIPVYPAIWSTRTRIAVVQEI
jgi:hypothetical protein